MEKKKKYSKHKYCFWNTLIFILVLYLLGIGDSPLSSLIKNFDWITMGGLFFTIIATYFSCYLLILVYEKIFKKDFITFKKDK